MNLRNENINIEVLDYVIELLLKYPSLDLELKNDIELHIYKEEPNGFDILLVTDEREITLYLGQFHWHYDYLEYEINEMIERLFFAMTSVCRIKEFIKEEEPYKWNIEITNQAGEWFNEGTLTTFNFKFWIVPKIRYLQNHLLPREILLADQIKKGFMRK